MLRAAAILATGIGKSLVAAPLDAIASPIRTLVGEVRRLLEASRAGERVEGLRRAQGEARFDPTETSALFRLGERDGSLDVADTNGGRVVYDRGRNEALGYPLIRQILRGEIEPLHGLPAYLKRLTRTAGSHGTLLKENFAALSGFAQAMLLVFRSGAVPETFADGLAETLDTVPSDGLPKVAAPPEQTVELAPGRPSRGTRLSGDDDGKEDEDGAFGSRYGTPPPDAAPHAQSGDADGSGGADGGSDGDGSGDADEGTTAGRRDASELTASEPTASDGATQGASGAARQSSGEVPPIELVDGRLPNDAVATVAERAAQFRAWAASLGHRADRFATMNIDAHDSRHAEVVLPPTQAGERILNAIEKEYIEAYADDPDETFDDATFSASAWPTSPLRTQVYERRRVDEDEFVTDLTRNLRALTGGDASVNALPLPDKIGLYHELLKDFAKSYVDGARREWGDVPKGALGEGWSERRYFDLTVPGHAVAPAQLLPAVGAPSSGCRQPFERRLPNGTTLHRPNSGVPTDNAESQRRTHTWPLEA